MIYATLAQMAEHRTCNARVVCSIHTGGSTHISVGYYFVHYVSYRLHNELLKKLS